MLQYITQGKTAEEHIEAARSAVEAGCTWVQLRMKRMSREVIFETAKEVRDICGEECTFIMNDHSDIAAEVGADGVHLGKKDLAPNAARIILGNDAIIGGTANTFEDIEYLRLQGVNYIGLGPFRFTTTKEKLSPVLGVEGYAKIMNQMKKAGIKIPVVAIGGIQLEDIPGIMSTGVSGIAVSGLLTHAEDKKVIVDNISNVVF